MLSLAESLSYIEKSKATKLREQSIAITKMLSAFIGKLD